MPALEGFDTFTLVGKPNGALSIVFCVACVIVFILDKMSNGALTVIGIKDNYAVIEYGQYYRLFSCTFLHLGLIHLISNMIFIFKYGKYSEFFYGHAKYIIVMLMSGLAGSLYSLAFTDARSVGASGIAFGIAASLISVR